MTYFYQKRVLSKQLQSGYEHRGGQIRGALFNFLVVKKCPFLYLPDTALSF